MGEANTARASSFLGVQFNAFLFAPIGADDRGRQVTVVSALARLDLDPWDEADRLSRLPDETAARSISMVISRFPEIPLGVAGARQTAIRLVGLLPKRLLGNQMKPPFGAKVILHALPLGVAAVVLCAVSVLFLGQILLQTHHAGRVAAPMPLASQAKPFSPAPAGQ